MPSVGLLFRVAIMPGRLSPHQMQPGGALADIEQGVGAGTRAASIKKRDKRHRWKQATRSMGIVVCLVTESKRDAHEPACHQIEYPIGDDVLIVSNLFQ